MARTKARRNKGFSTYREGTGWRAAIVIGTAGGNLKRKSFRGKSEDEVIRKVREFQGRAEAMGMPNALRSNTCGEWIEEWLSSNQQVWAYNTHRFHESRIRHLSPTIFSLPLADLNTGHLQREVNRYVTEGLDPRPFVRTLRSCFNEAYKQQRIKNPVATFLKVPRFDGQDKVLHLEIEEAQRLLVACEGTPIEALVLFGLSTGVRVAEALGLRWTDVDLNAAEITLRVQLQYIGGQFVHRPLKTHRRTSIPISKNVKKAIELAREQQDGPGTCELNLVFLNNQGRPCHQKWLNKHMHAACDRANIRRIGFHVLRHTAASLMLAQGASLIDVKEQLGHTSIALLGSTYGHSLNPARRAAADKLSDAIAGNQD